ncbi:MAG: hypothetical protein IJJ47_10320 [Methanosphaera sp.]|nr:hypothetical protein [Methanosphaera sp.]
MMIGFAKRLNTFLDNFSKVKCPVCGEDVSTRYPYYQDDGRRLVHCSCGNVIILDKKMGSK